MLTLQRLSFRQHLIITQVTQFSQHRLIGQSDHVSKSKTTLFAQVKQPFYVDYHKENIYRRRVLPVLRQFPRLEPFFLHLNPSRSATYRHQLASRVSLAQLSSLITLKPRQLGCRDSWVNRLAMYSKLVFPWGWRAKKYRGTGFWVFCPREK